MKKWQKLAVIAAILGIVVAGFASLKIYFIRDDSAGNLLWNADEAYLFMNVSRRGIRMSYLEYPLVLLKEYLHGVYGPDDQRTSVTVVHVTAAGVEHHVVEMLDEEQANTPDLYTPFEGGIYANCHGSLCKWTGNKFETATEEEQRQLGGTNHLSAKDIDKSTGGWSKRSFTAASVDYRVAEDVGEKFTLAVRNKLLEPRGHSTVSVDVARPGQPPEPIWQCNGRPRRVSKTEYERAFERR
jgi:hypothetical protein